MKRIKGTSWNNGHPDYKTGSGFGIRISQADRNGYFDIQSKGVFLQLEGELESIFVTTKRMSFWNNCSELRNKKIGTWLIKNKCDKWPKYKPHRFDLFIISSDTILVKFV